MRTEKLRTVVTMLILSMVLFSSYRVKSENIKPESDTIQCIIVYVDTATQRMYADNKLTAIKYIGGHDIKWCFGYTIWRASGDDFKYELYDEFYHRFINESNTRYVLDVYFITEDEEDF